MNADVTKSKKHMHRNLSLKLFKHFNIQSNFSVSGLNIQYWDSQKWKIHVVFANSILEFNHTVYKNEMSDN